MICCYPKYFEMKNEMNEKWNEKCNEISNAGVLVNVNVYRTVRRWSADKTGRIAAYGTCDVIARATFECAMSSYDCVLIPCSRLRLSGRLNDDDDD